MGMFMDQCEDKNCSCQDYHQCKSSIQSLYITKDSGKRQEFSTGMVRDIQDNKPRYDLIWLPGLKRLAELMTRGAIKYGPRNWEKASTKEELERFKSSAMRHFMQWMNEEMDEDHLSATIFNMFGTAYTQQQLNNVQKTDRK